MKVQLPARYRFKRIFDWYFGIIFSKPELKFRNKIPQISKLFLAINKLMKAPYFVDMFFDYDTGKFCSKNF